MRPCWVFGMSILKSILEGSVYSDDGKQSNAMPQFAGFIEWLVGLSESNQSMVVDYYLSSIQLWFCVNLPFPISHFHLL